MKTLLKNKLAVKRYKTIMNIGNWLSQLPYKLTPPPFRLIQIGSAFWQSRALYIAIKLGISDVLGSSKKSTSNIAETLNLSEDHLYRLMRMLASIGVFEELSPRFFKNNKTSHYLRENNPNNIRAMILMHNSREMSLPWMESLEESIKDGGIPFKKINKLDLFEYMNKNKDFDSLFSKAMDSVENVAGSDFLQDLNWKRFTRIIDVGGSKGAKSLAILKNNPKLKAVVYDRPQVIKEAENYWKGNIDNSLLSRVKFVEGNMLESVPPAESDTDAYFLMAVFHTFNNSQCQKILANLKHAVGNKKPYIIIADAVAEEMNINPFIAAMDMQMLMGTEGRERTLSEWNLLFKNTGFKIEEIIEARTFVKYIVLKPK